MTSYACYQCIRFKIRRRFADLLFRSTYQIFFWKRPFNLETETVLNLETETFLLQLLKRSGMTRPIQELLDVQ